MTDNQNADSQVSVDDVWGAAMSEQVAGESKAAESVFKALNPSVGAEMPLRDLNMIADIPLIISVILGKTKMTIKELLAVSPGTVVPLQGLAGAPLEVHANKYLLAKGEVVVVNDHYGVRITEILSPSERLQHMAQ